MTAWPTRASRRRTKEVAPGLSIAGTAHAPHVPSPALDASIMQPAANLVYTNPLCPEGRRLLLPMQFSPPASCTEAGLFDATISFSGAGRHDGRGQWVPLLPLANPRATRAGRLCRAPLLLGSDLPWRQIQATLRCPTTTARPHPHAHSHSVLCRGSGQSSVDPTHPLSLPERGSSNLDSRPRSGCRGHLRLAVPPHAPHAPTQCCLAMLQCEVTAPAVSDRGFARTLRHFHGRMPHCGNGLNDPAAVRAGAMQRLGQNTFFHQQHGRGEGQMQLSPCRSTLG